MTMDIGVVSANTPEAPQAPNDAGGEAKETGSQGDLADAFAASVAANLEAMKMKAEYDAAMAFAQLRTK